MRAWRVASLSFLLLLAGMVVTGGGLILPAGAAARATHPDGAANHRILTDAVPLGGLAGAAWVSAVPLRLTLALTPANASRLQALDARAADPANPSTDRYLSESEFVREFAAPVANLSALESYFAGHGGAHFVPTADRLGLSFDLPERDVSAALGVSPRLLAGDAAGVRYDTPGEPTLPPSLSSMVTGIGGLTDLARLAPAHALAGARASPVPGGAASTGRHAGQFVTVTGTQVQLYVGSDLAQAYGVNALFPGGPATGNRSYPTNSAVATILSSSYNISSQADLPPFDPAVVAQYFNDTLPASWPAPTVLGVPVALGGVTPPAPGPFGNATDDLLSEDENSLDLEMAGSMAPGALLANFYFASSVFENSPSATYGDLADAFSVCLAAALNYDYGTHHLVAVTNSYGLPDLVDPLWNTELAHAAALGVTVVAASGDQGNAPENLTGRPQGANPGWPATAAYNDSGVLAVGGSEVTLNGLPTAIFDPASGFLNVTYDTSVAGIANEAVWYTTAQGPGAYAGSEGGISGQYGEPAWQVASAAQPAIVNATVIAGQSALGRALPDLALNAQNMIVYVAANASGTYFEVLSGTSVSSPLVAGILATSAAVVGHTFGYLDPWLYRLGSYYAAQPNASDPLRGIDQGQNYLYQAAPGWDAATGWGSLNVALLPAALTDPAIGAFNYTGPSPGLPPYHPHHTDPVPPSPPLPLPVWEVAAAAAVVMVIALYIAIRFEGPAPVPPPPGVFAPVGSTAAAVPYRPVCAACGRESAPWLAVCPWCGTPRH